MLQQVGAASGGDRCPPENLPAAVYIRYRSRRQFALISQYILARNVPPPAVNKEARKPDKALKWKVIYKLLRLGMVSS
jgi:hypothetical protein